MRGGVRQGFFKVGEGTALMLRQGVRVPDTGQ